MNTEKIQKAARNLFEGVVPERKNELAQLWSKYSPNFSLLPEVGPDGIFIMQGGLYRNIWFNHRAMRAFWFGSFVAWEGYKRTVEKANFKSTNLSNFYSMIDLFSEIMNKDNSAEEPLPNGIPEPGIYVDKDTHVEYRATAEIATMATGWAFLHEMRHIQHQQDGTGVTNDSPPSRIHEEEYSCDEYATKFLLDQIDIYVAEENINYETLKLKRELAIYFALFVMTLVSHNKWDESDTHPALQDRIDRIVKLMSSKVTSESGVIGLCSFISLWSKWEHAPGPFKTTGM